MLFLKNKLKEDRLASDQSYAHYEYELTRRIIIPLLRKWGIYFEDKKLLDIGCALGGSTVAFWENGSKSVGVDIEARYIKGAKIFARKKEARVSFVLTDMSTQKGKEGLEGQQIIILRDVIEHVPPERRKELIVNIGEILMKGGFCFVSFPPYHSPFGGHQHCFKSINRFIPYVHLMPIALELGLISLDGNVRKRVSTEEWNRFWDWRAMARKGKTTIASFETLVSLSCLNIMKRALYLIRPVFSYRYGLPPVRNVVFGKVPGLRELTSTGALYLLRKE